jgi:hypothetical protein
MNHHDFLVEVAGVTPPSRLRALLVYLAGTLDIISPEETKGLHPLLIPIGRDEEKSIYGFLRWPTPTSDMELPLVRQHEYGLQLMANSADEMLHRELAWRDATPDEEPGPLLAAVNKESMLYEVGTVAASGLPLPAYFLLKVGVPSSFFTELIDGHLERGDEIAAQVAATRACSLAPGWGFPNVMMARLLVKLGRLEEARDAARAALLESVWTLGCPFEPVARLAGWKDPIDGQPYRKLADDDSKPLLDRAAHFMDAIAAEGYDWDPARPELARRYEEAGLATLAGLIGR